MTHGQPRPGFRRVSGYVSEAVYAHLARLGARSVSQALGQALTEWDALEPPSEGVTPHPSAEREAGA